VNSEIVTVHISDSSSVSFELRWLQRLDQESLVKLPLGYLHTCKSITARLGGESFKQQTKTYLSSVADLQSAFTNLLADRLTTDAVCGPPSKRADLYRPYLEAVVQHLPSSSIDLSPWFKRTESVSFGYADRPAEVWSSITFDVPKHVQPPKGVLILDDVYSKGTTTGRMVQLLREHYPGVELTVAVPLRIGR
jgi:hypothetical protein